MGELKYIPFEEESENIKSRVADYWTERADSFFVQRQHELNSAKADRWLGEINVQIANVEAENGAKPESLRILDIGCGSGILSMIGVYLGAGYVKGIDIDPQAIKSSHANAAVTGFSDDRIDFEVGNLLAEVDDAKSGSGFGVSSVDEKFDIVVANILADVIIPLSSKVRPYMKEDGLFITSGIIDEKEDIL